MSRSYASAIVAAKADEVWRLVRDFDGLPRWHPAVADSRIEDGRSAAEVGCVRHLKMPDGAVIRERLVAVDDPGRSYTYDIIESPFPIRRYRATIRVVPVTATGDSFVEWWTDFDADASDEPKLDKVFANNVFAAGLQALQERFSG